MELNEYPIGLRNRASPFLDSYLIHSGRNELIEMEVEMIALKVLDNLGNFELIEVRKEWITIKDKEIRGVKAKIKRLTDLRYTAEFTEVTSINNKISYLKTEILFLQEERAVRERLLMEALEGVNWEGLEVTPFFHTYKERNKETTQETNHELVEKKTSEVLSNLRR